ncbi:MAG: ComEC/Rec2 family competence protein [Spirochaetes bacterium]|nr:ComEC/Rec2 family competence protein [Spirochaetota bacterium]
MHRSHPDRQPHWLPVLALAAALPLYLPASPVCRAATTLLALLLAGIALRPATGGTARHPVLVRIPVAAKRPDGLSLLLLWLACGLLAGVVLQARRESLASASGTGLPSSMISYTEASLTADGYLSASGWRMYPVQLVQVRSSAGAQASAAGSGLFYVRGGLALPPGSRITVQAKPVPAQNGPALLWFAEKADLRLKQAAPPWQQLRFRARQALLAAIRQAAGADAAPLMEALLLGVRDQLNSELAANFRQAGCAHILALSGQHLSILTGMLGLLLGWLPAKRTARLVNCLLIGVYIAITGAGPSVLRAALMFWYASLGRLLDRPQPAAASLGFAFFASLLLQPENCASLSFILSYSASAGILAFGPAFAFLLRRLLPPSWASALGTGWAAFLATAAVVAGSFGVLYPAGPFISILAAPLVVALLWAGVSASLLVAICPALASLTKPVCSSLYELLQLLMAAGVGRPALPLPEGRSRLMVSTAIALSVLLVYAVLHVRFRQPTRLQLAQRTGRTAGQPGLCHAKKVRPELSDQPGCPSAPLRPAAG